MGKLQLTRKLQTTSDLSFFLTGANSFNQDLSHLCVPLITEEPTNFATGATANTGSYPIWGTCPGNN